MKVDIKKCENGHVHFHMKVHFHRSANVNFLICSLQGCWANSDGANSDDRANSDDFLGKSLELIFVIIPTFSQILAT